MKALKVEYKIYKSSLSAAAIKKSFLTMILIISTFISLCASPYKVNYITADIGLSRNTVNNIYRDSQGFIWISTSNGLDRYDGYEFIHFNTRTAKNVMLSNNVRSVCEDKLGNIWLGTETGLFYFDYKKSKIVSAAEVLEKSTELGTKNIQLLLKDAVGDIWIAYERSLIRLQYSDDKITESLVFENNQAFNTLIFDKNNIIFGSENSVFSLMKGSDGLYKKRNLSDKLRTLNGSVNALLTDNNTLWIGSSSGLYKFDLNSDILNLYTANSERNSSLTTNYVTDLAKSQSGQILVATLIGVNIYDYRSDKFDYLTTDSSFGGTFLNNNFCSCLFVDADAIWIGTEKGGVNLLTPDISVFTNIYHIPSVKTSISRNPVNAIFEDKFGDLWVGTVEGGLNVRRKGKTEFEHYFSESGNRSSLSHNSVSSICQDYKGDYWFGTWGRGLNKISANNRLNPRFDQFVYSSNTENSIINDFIAALTPDDQNRALWVGTRNGLDYIDLETYKITHILNFLPGDEMLRFITGMFIDSKRRLWIGTGNGLFCVFLNKTDIHKNKISYQHFKYELNSNQTKRVLKVNCILETKDGKIWFGSNGSGIYSLSNNSKSLVFRNFNENTGLPDNVIYGMLEDEAGTLWLSTDKGLCSFDPDKNSSRNFTTADGLKSNQFYWDAYFKGIDGKMYFGNMAGLTSFDPLKLSNLNTKSNVRISRIKILNEDIYPLNTKEIKAGLEYADGKLQKLVLKESDKAFSVEFSALTFVLADKIKYAYRLKGFSNKWTEVASDRRFANFTNINNGSYELEIKACNADGVWSEELTVLQITVIPPFYKTWWFLILLILLIGVSVYQYYRYRFNLLTKQKLQLKKLVEERTHEIEQQKGILEEQASQLKQNMEALLDHQLEMSRQNETLTQQNQKITYQKEQLLNLSRKVKEANLDKIAFFTNITHEFRTPITLILGPIERSLKLSTNPKVLEQLHIVKRNSRLLLGLINQLMDFRKVDSGKMELVKTQQNFISFLDELILPFEDLVKERGITFSKQYRINPPEFLFDADNLQKVIGNLLSNAIKFTPDNGQITVVASTYTDKNDRKERLYLAVKDTGKGIPEEDIEKIFDRFYQSKQNQTISGIGQSGTGIGLYLCKRIIQLHNGKIEARNQNTGGSSFRFIIPIERRLSVMVSTNGSSDEMYVANQHEFETENYQGEIKNKPVLLIVEDNSDMRQYIRSILTNDFNVIEAQNGLVGLEMTNRYQPDLVISDIMMPEMDGLEYCKRVKNNFTTSHIPVILLTAKSATDTQIESFNIGADAFLVKPFDEDLLKAIIQNLSEKRNRKQLNFAENMDAEALNFNNESPDKQFIDKALLILKSNYTNSDFDVTEFIDAMGISRSLLHKKLKNIAGQSASRFIRIYRLNIARELLIMNRENHSLNISEIAYKVGFNDPKYFTRCFTKHFGTQPSAFLDEDKH